MITQEQYIYKVSKLLSVDTMSMTLGGLRNVTKLVLSVLVEMQRPLAIEKDVQCLF